jgi:hypothetical protein
LSISAIIATTSSTCIAERGIEQAPERLSGRQRNLLGGESEQRGERDDGDEVDDENGVCYGQTNGGRVALHWRSERRFYTEEGGKEKTLVAPARHGPEGIVGTPPPLYVACALALAPQLWRCHWTSGPWRNRHMSLADGLRYKKNYTKKNLIWKN